MSTTRPTNAVDVHDARVTAVQIARELDELARALNYATLPGRTRLEYAADVYEVLGSLRAALAKLPQACGQLADFLARQHGDGALRAEQGFPHAGDPAAAVHAGRASLSQAAIAANVAATVCGRAQEAISGLSNVEPDQPVRRRPHAIGGAILKDHTHGRERAIEP